MSILHIIKAGKKAHLGSAVVQSQKAVNWDNNSGNYVIADSVLANTGLFNSKNEYRDLKEYRTTPLNVTGTETVISAVTDKSIEVVNYVIVVDAAATVMFTSNDDEVLASGISLAANGGVAFDGELAFKTSPSEALKMTVSTGNAAGHITYRIV